MHVKTRNVKGHFRVSSSPILVPETLKKHTVQYSNFWTFRPGGQSIGNLVYVVFPSAGYVNVSGLNDFDVGEYAKQHFINLFEIDGDVSDFIVDSSTASGVFDVPAEEGTDLSRLLTLMTSSEGERPQYPCTISIRPCYFPSALIRPKSAFKNTIATCIIFSNGKFVVVGSKSKAQTERTINNLIPYFQKKETS